MDPSHFSCSPTPTAALPLSPTKPAPSRTLDQQLEALGAAEEGDGGHGGLTDVGARRIEGDGAQRERGAVPQGD